APATLHAIKQMSEGLAVALAHEQVVGIGRDRKRLAGQSEELGIHGPEHTGGHGGGQTARRGSGLPQAARAIEGLAPEAADLAAAPSTTHSMSPESWPPSSITILP